MIGVLELTQTGGRRPQLWEERLLGLRALHAAVPAPERGGERGLVRRVERAAQAMRRAGIRRVLTAPQFPLWPRLLEAGLRPVDPEPFCQANAAGLVMGALAQRGTDPARATVSIEAAGVSRALSRAAEALCTKVRYLSLNLPDDGKLAEHLRWEYGVAVLTGVDTPDVSLQFAPGESRGKTVLRLHGPSLDLSGLCPVANQPLPPELDRLSLAALLWEVGELPEARVRFLPGSMQQPT